MSNFSKAVKEIRFNFMDLLALFEPLFGKF